MAAARTYYSFHIAPTFWDWLIDKHREDRLFSCDAVLQEILRGNDQLARWAADSVPRGFWLQPQECAFHHAAELINWATAPQQRYKSSAIDQFADSADLLLIAQAKEHGAQIITHEVSNPQSQKRILLPDAASTLGVPCPSPWEVFTQLGLRL